MFTLFEVYLKHVPKDLFSKEVQAQTGAVIMTYEEAEQLGISGFTPQNLGTLRLIIVKTKDASWIRHALEGNHDVNHFQDHEIDLNEEL